MGQGRACPTQAPGWVERMWVWSHTDLCASSWMNTLTSLCLSFSTSKTGTVMLTLKAGCKNETLLMIIPKGPGMEPGTQQALGFIITWLNYM